MVDAAGILSNFQRMNRIADGTGIPLDSTGSDKIDAIRHQMNDVMGISAYSSSVNTLGAS